MCPLARALRSQYMRAGRRSDACARALSRAGPLASHLDSRRVAATTVREATHCNAFGSRTRAYSYAALTHARALSATPFPPLRSPKQFRTPIRVGLGEAPSVVGGGA